MPSFGQAILDYHRDLPAQLDLPPGVDLLFPYDDARTWEAMTAFYLTYFPDDGPRTFLFGINPGRFGAGITGVPFTDPLRLEEPCGIANDFDKKPELSSIFIYQMIEAMGGPSVFYRQFYITSMSPLGFIKDGKNWNYYDDAATLQAVKPFIVQHLQDQLALGANPQVAYSVGRGKNFDFFQKLNAEHQFFQAIQPLPHPRWVMQYRRKQIDQFIREYREALGARV